MMEQQDRLCEAGGALYIGCSCLPAPYTNPKPPPILRQLLPGSCQRRPRNIPRVLSGRSCSPQDRAWVSAHHACTRLTLAFFPGELSLLHCARTFRSTSEACSSRVLKSYLGRGRKRSPIGEKAGVDVINLTGAGKNLPLQRMPG